MKKIYFYTIVISLFFFSISCNEILDTSPYNQLASGNMWKTESLVDQGVLGVYYSLRYPVQSGGIVGESLNLGYYGWEVFGSTGQSRLSVNDVFQSSVKPSNSHFSYVWRWAYDGIHRANDAIAHIPSAPIKDDKKSRLIAECKTLRAFFYMRLNELFGTNGMGVPIYTEPISPSEANRTQSNESVVWNLVISDLTDAINTSTLPNNDINGQGRISKGAAYALRGRAYLLTKEYGKAAADFSQVASCGYGLFSDYKTMFKPANDKNKEMILYVQNIEDPSGYGSRLQKYCAPWNAGSQDSRGCWTDMQVSPFVVDLYEVKMDNATVKPFKWDDFIPTWSNTPLNDRQVYFIRDRKLNGAAIHSTITTAVANQLNKVSANYRSLYLDEGNEARIKAVYANRDPRLNYSVIVPYSSFIGVNSNSTAAGEYVSRWPVSGKYYFDQSGAESVLVPGMKTSLVANGQNYFYYMFRKFVGEGLEYKLRQDNPVDEPIIRYADVLLMWAEALVELNDLSGAKDKVKQVRDRVSMPTMDIYFSDQATARNYVRDERRREFVCEGVNFFDEMRWHTLKDTKFNYGAQTSMQVWGGVATGNPIMSWNDFWYTWPVPKAETELNPNLVKTPGWNYN